MTASTPLPAIGDPAPDFTLPTDGGGTLSLSSLRGRVVVLYFYPKDNTPGCTQEALDFRAMATDLEAAGAVVVGASKDSVKSHDGFKAKHDLPFTLVSDADGTLCETYGVWQEKKNYGRCYEGIVRTTVVIDRLGRVARVWSPVKVTGHAAAVYDFVTTLPL